AGSDSLRRSLGWFDFFARTLSKVPSVILAAALIAVAVGVVVIPKLLPENGKYAEYGGIAIFVILVGFSVLNALNQRVSIQVPGLEVSLGTSDRKRVLRGLSGIVSEFSTGTRESFLHQLGGLRSLEPELRDATARSIARQFG